MALIKCKECGNDVSTQAQSCPKCGAVVAKQKKPTGCGTLLIALFCAFVVVAIIISRVSGDKGDAASDAGLTPSQASAKHLHDLAVVRAGEGAKLLKQSMRDPDSFKLSQALIMDSGAVCYEFRAHNGFGGMDVGHAVYASDGVTFKSNTDPGFEDIWNAECQGKQGEDYSGGLNAMD